MIPYKQEPLRTIKIDDVNVASFVSAKGQVGDRLNADEKTIDSFGAEWNRFASFTQEEIKSAGDSYFDIVTGEMLNENSTALDIGCGTGRWSKYISSRVKFVEAVDPGEAILAAVPFTKSCGNVRITQAGYGNLPFEKGSFDFVFSLGVVHHLPDTQAAIGEAASMLKKGGWLLLYIYYSLDTRGRLFRFLFAVSDFFRKIISKFPKGLKFFTCELIAIFIYLPFVLFAKFIRLFGGNAWKKVPLSYYAGQPWKVIRNDSLDRFGTPLEKRFSKKEIETMLMNSGLGEIRFSENDPYWHVVARK
ncbi:MAG TPA: class I SAM-dependent methyltransferase [Bacteroidia bacterium]|nr:class I SAM-dependent methyltransferase [Bacteroidia bacterium]